MKNKITNLAELEKEQEKLTMMMEVTRQEFARNFGTNRKQLNEFLLKKVALPIGVAGIGAVVTKKMISRESKNKVVTTSSSNADFLKKIFPIGLGLLQAYFLKQQKDTPVESQSKTNIPSENVNKLKSVA